MNYRGKSDMQDMALKIYESGTLGLVSSTLVSILTTLLRTSDLRYETLQNACQMIQ